MIEVIYSQQIQVYTNCDKEYIAAGSLREIFKYISNEYGKEAEREVKSSLVTQNSMRLYNKQGKLVNGDIIKFIPVCSGG